MKGFCSWFLYIFCAERKNQWYFINIHVQCTGIENIDFWQDFTFLCPSCLKKEGHIVLHKSVSISLDWSVSLQHLVLLIIQEVFASEASNLVEQRNIFCQVTIFRHLFSFSCNFCIFHRNRFLSFMSMKSNYIFTRQIKEMAKICFNTLKIIVVKYGEIWSLAKCDTFVVLNKMIPIESQVSTVVEVDVI